tara:strand:- start:140 stop:298 length:159 start_codon:yes stop_codon:yes gene_type:complete
MKINRLDFDGEECSDRWTRREKKVKNRTKLKEPKNNKEKTLTSSVKKSIIKQ